jgi:hypothetical protein
MTTRILGVALSAALLLTTGAAAKPHALKGTVVHRNHHARSVVVASSKGVLHKVRVRHGKARFARHVAFRATRTRTGAFTTRHMSDHGDATTAKVRGAVTFVDTAARTFTVSDNGASILVHLADTAKALPAVGDTVLVVADLTTSTPTQLEATDVVVNPDAAAAKAVEIEGVVLAIDQDKRVLTLSADDDNESGKMIAVTLPAEFDITKFAVGQEVELLATLNDDGQTFTATSVDDHNCGDDDFGDGDQGDNNDNQGDDHEGDHHDGGDQQATSDQTGDSATSSSDSQSGDSHDD